MTGEIVEMDGTTVQWYIVRAKPRAEQLAAASLEARGLPTYLPQWRRRLRRHAEQQEPLFPGYLFVQSDGRRDWVLRARSAPNVARLLGNDSGPEPVPDELIEQIRSRCAQQGDDAFIPGQRVRITRGPFRDLDAIFDASLRAGDRARVLVHLVRKLVPVILEVDALRRAG